MARKLYPGPSPLLLSGYDPEYTLLPDHLARLVDRIVDEAMPGPLTRTGRGQAAYDRRMCVKVLIYGYTMGIRSSRRLERACCEDLGFIFLTRGARPSYRTLCHVRVDESALLKEIWLALTLLAAESGISRMGNLVIDSTKIRANAGPDSTVKQADYEKVIGHFQQILQAAEEADLRDEQEHGREETHVAREVQPDQMRDMLRRVRSFGREQERAQATEPNKKSGAGAAANKPAANKSVNHKSDLDGEQEDEEQVVKPAPQKRSITRFSLPGRKPQKETGDLFAADTKDDDDDDRPSAGGTSSSTESQSVDTQCAGGEESQPPAAAPGKSSAASKAGVRALQTVELPGLGRLTLTAAMRKLLQAAVETLQSARAQGLKQVSLSDPDARMMGEGRSRNIRLCHTLEVVNDGIPRLMQRGPDRNDHDRLPALLRQLAAEQHGLLTSDGNFVPGAMEGLQVTADSGYYKNAAMLELLEAGVDLCVPSQYVANDLRHKVPVGTAMARGRASGEFTYNEEKNLFVCPQGKELRYNGKAVKRDQVVKKYRAKEPCTECPLASSCLKSAKAKHRTLAIATEDHVLKALQERFNDPDHVARYHQRGPGVETVFAYIRKVMNFERWMVRTAEKVAAEADLLGVAYTIRKIHNANLAQAT